VTLTNEIEDTIADQAIMFADVSGSSALYKQEGNVQAKQLIDQAVDLMKALTIEHSGIVVKTIGDEVMARFSDPSEACEAAISIQQHCSKIKASDGSHFSVRIGMDFGHTLLDGDDVFGDTVNDAACVAQIARPDQIVITQALVDALPSALQSLCQEFDRINIKGETVKTLIYRLAWENPTEEHSATTVMAANHITQKISTDHLQLTYAGKTVNVSTGDIPFIIGRDHRKVNLHIDSTIASRDHCQIVLRRGKFVLLDHSTNGTYVKTPDQPEVYLRREELPLMGEGTISIGRRANQQAELTIGYKL